MIVFYDALVETSNCRNIATSELFVLIGKKTNSFSISLYSSCYFFRYCNVTFVLQILKLFHVSQNTNFPLSEIDEEVLHALRA